MGLCASAVLSGGCVGIDRIATHNDKKIQGLLVKKLDNPGIDPGTSHMLSERSTI